MAVTHRKTIHPNRVYSSRELNPMVNQESAVSIPGAAHTVWVEGLSVTAIKTVEESVFNNI